MEVAGPAPETNDPVVQLAYMIRVFAACGYDYANCYGSDLVFPPAKRSEKYNLTECPCPD